MPTSPSTADAGASHFISALDTTCAEPGMPPREHPALDMCLPTTCTRDPPPAYPDRGYTPTASAGLRNSYSTSSSPFTTRSPPDPTATKPSPPPGTLLHTISPALGTEP